MVACVECGPNSNAAAFADAVKRARSGAAQETPELAAAFASWMTGMVQRSGTMTGAAPTNLGMARWPDSAGGVAKPFVKTIGPLPPDLGFQNMTWSSTKKVCER